MYHKEMNFEEIKEKLKRKFEEKLTELELQYKRKGTSIIDYINVDLIVEEIEPVLLPITFENISGHQQESKYRAWKYFWQTRKDLEEYLDCLENENCDSIEKLDDIVLSADYVEPDTYENQPDGYYRIQFSWGGPSDEIRVYLHDNDTVDLIEYVFLDWFIGIGWNVTSDDVFYEFTKEAMAIYFDKIVN